MLKSETSTSALKLVAQRRDAELKALYLIAQAVNFTMPLDDVLELLYTQLQRVIPVPNFYIALVDFEAQQFYFAFYVEGGERQYPNLRWGVDQGLTGFLFRNGGIIRTEDYLTECQIRGVEPGGRPAKAWMGVPLLAQDQTIGVMVISEQDPDVVFSEEDASFMMTVASYLASGIERRRLHERLETHARQLRTLNEIGKLLASSLDLEEVLDLVVRNAAQLLDSEAGSLLLLDDDGSDLVFRISSGPAGDRLVGHRVPAGKGIAGKAFEENRPVIVNDVEHDEQWYAAFDAQADFVTRSVLAVPLSTRGRSIGVLEVINHEGNRPFHADDADLLQSFAAQAAIAIENARLFTTTDQALQARVEELTTLQHIDRQLNATLDYREIMDLTLSWAIRLTGAEIGLMAALREEEDGTRGLQFLASKGYPDDLVQRYTDEALWPLDKGLVGQTVLKGETMLVRDVQAHTDYVEVVPGMQAQLSVPVRRENRVIGVVALESPDPDCFSDEEIMLAARLVDHAAIAIDNARLFQQVQRANQAKTEFIDFVSHELKQPMTSMKGYIDLLKKGLGGPLTTQQEQFLDVIYSNVQRMNRLVQDLLDMSRIEAGRVHLEIKPVSPVAITREAVQSFRQAIEDKRQALRMEVEEGLPLVLGDRGRLIQVLTNLLSNANKYTPEGGEITVRVEACRMDDQDAYVCWHVEDSGIGMTAEEMEKLFTKFFRADVPEVRNVKGTGLGLVITRSLVEMHGGHIRVQSEPGEGSTFTFMIPVSSGV
ncbi:MAG: GAF domain-containing protein [Anaerolineae bacterium]